MQGTIEWETAVLMLPIASDHIDVRKQLLPVS